MSSINKVILIGNIGQDPEIKYTAKGDAVVNLSLATSEQWVDKASGEKKEQTEWHRISIFGKPAEIAAQYLKKGSKIYVEGKIRTRKYTDQQGAERQSTDILCDSFKMLGSSEAKQTNATKPTKPSAKVHDLDEDSIPF
jgi:single-strand DNA-binding protein